MDKDNDPKRNTGLFFKEQKEHTNLSAKPKEKLNRHKSPSKQRNKKFYSHPQPNDSGGESRGGELNFSSPIPTSK